MEPRAKELWPATEPGQEGTTAMGVAQEPAGDLGLRGPGAEDGHNNQAACASGVNGDCGDAGRGATARHRHGVAPVGTAMAEMRRGPRTCARGEIKRQGGYGETRGWN